MCGEPRDVADAMSMLDRALAVLATADVASLPAQSQAEVLRALERAESRHTAARARALAAFDAQDGHYDDGQHSARAWLVWQTRITRGAAAGAVGWSRRLAGHPVIADGLAAGTLSASWARQICDWTDRLPGSQREDADRILAGAALGGADLPDLAGLAEEMYRRSAGPDQEDDGFEDRYLRLGITFRGAGRAEGDLTPGCAAALGAVLDALGKKAGPEDTRTAGQRRHDALEEACRRLIAAGTLPDRAGQPTQIQVHLTLSQLRGLPGAAAAEREWAGRHHAGEPGWLTGPEAEAAACDATVVPIVTGHPDPAALGSLVSAIAEAGTGSPEAGTGSPQVPLSARSHRRLSRALLGLAADTLSGPGGLAAWLRTGLLDVPELISPSLPLDIGAGTETIPAHLRRAVVARHPHCGFPGCRQPAAVCQIHHLIARARGGPTALGNLITLCSFHHLVVIHRWRWSLRLNPDGTTTATSPDGSRTLHSHGPPAQAA